MRGFAPLLVALASGALIGEALSRGGVARRRRHQRRRALVGLSRIRATALHHGKALRFAFANAAIIAVYTVVDGLGVRAVGRRAALRR